MRRAARIAAAVALAAAALGAASAIAQDDAADKPRPAEKVARATAGLLLDVTRAGTAWIAVGDHGVILRSEDGRQWTQIASPLDITFNRVRFFDEHHGWIVGYDGSVLESRDGGRLWRLAQYEGAAGRPYFDVLFVDTVQGWLAGANGVLKRSADGGASWAPVADGVLQDQPNLYALQRLGDGSLLLAGERGFLAQSTDAGQNWSVLKSPYSGAYFGAMPIGEHGALVFGLRGNAFYADDLRSAPRLSAADRDALRRAADDPESSARSIDPVSAVPGWAHLAGSDRESLFGGTRTAAGRVLLFGNNGRVVEADLAGGHLQRLPVTNGANLSAGVDAGDGLIVVGSFGLRRLPPVR